MLRLEGEDDEQRFASASLKLASVLRFTGELSVAQGEFQFLAGAAMRAEDFALAESMLMEYLEVEPRCALLIEALGQVYEHKGDASGALERYGQALTIMLEHPDPDQPGLAQDLFDKLKELAPGNEMLTRFAEALKGAPPTAEVRDLEGLSRAEASDQGESQPQEEQAAAGPLWPA